MAFAVVTSVTNKSTKE